ncbi:putative cue domain-containing protein [Erysiphe necator]|uniref:Putative cue domain-containing protein n=1 Tax=Uncinula necator TaxID=52586 RepID=A0A0B1NWI5_UNCNE|nr:putative cue domain-containing protein [Erysiphe necator]
MSNHSRNEAKLDSPFKHCHGAESPTTVKPFDMDDDEIPEPAVGVIEAPNSSETIKMNDNPPNQPLQQPPQIINHDVKAEDTLKDAFPSIDIAVIKAVLRASGGQIEPAFNALLGMSDPEATQDLSNPPTSFHSTANNGAGSTPLSQLEADERYARQLANQYQYQYNDARENLGSMRNNPRRNLAPTPDRRQNIYEERSFLEDDLPIIKDNLKKGFLETQNKVSNWITFLKKKIDGDDDADSVHQNYGSTSRLNRFKDDGRKSDDFSPYDADPQVLSDDFAGIQLHSDGTLASQSNKADKSQLKSNPVSSKNSYGYQALGVVSPSKINETYTINSNTEDKSTVKQSKWQPLSTVDSSNINDADNDPFSLGDTDDEKDVRDRAPDKEVKPSLAEAHDKSMTGIKNNKIVESESNCINTPIIK